MPDQIADEIADKSQAGVLTLDPTTMRALPADAHGVTATFLGVRPDPTQLTHLAALVDDGRLLSVVAHRFPLADGRVAFEAATAQTRPGKTVLVVHG